MSIDEFARVLPFGIGVVLIATTLLGADTDGNEEILFGLALCGSWLWLLYRRIRPSPDIQSP